MRKEQNDQRLVEAYERIIEGKMAKGYWVSLHGRAGELDSAFVKDKKGIKAVLIDWSSQLSDGDTIKIKKGESEQK